MPSNAHEVNDEVNCVVLLRFIALRHVATLIGANLALILDLLVQACLVVIVRVNIPRFEHCTFPVLSLSVF